MEIFSIVMNVCFASDLRGEFTVDDSYITFIPHEDDGEWDIPTQSFTITEDRTIWGMFCASFPGCVEFDEFEPCIRKLEKLVQAL